MKPICWLTRIFGRFFKFYSLRSQIIASFALLTILGVSAVGLTALQINYRYLENEKRAQSLVIVRDFYNSQETELGNMVVLAASHLSFVTEAGNPFSENELAYLDLFQKSYSKIDLISICDHTGKEISSVGTELPVSNCKFESNPFYAVINQKDQAEVWMLRGRKIFEEDPESNIIVMGIHLDDPFLMGMCDHCNLYHSLINEETMIASSFGTKYAQKTNIRLIPSQLADEEFQESFTIQDHEYYVSRFPLNAGGLEVEVALDVTSIHQDHHQQELLLSVIIIVILLISILFGAFLAQCIQQPLSQLVSITKGDQTHNLSTPFVVNTKLSEVIELTQTLEDARLRINQALTSLQKEKKWSDLLLQSMVEGIITLEKDKITYFSPGAERITGWTQDEVLNKSINQVLIPSEKPQNFLAILPKVGEKLRSTITVKAGLDKILAITHAQLSASNTDEDATVLVLRDVNEEEAMSHLLASFLGNITHEFRTPLSAMAASIEILLNEDDDLEKHEIKELLRSIHLSTLNLENLIDNLLEGSSIETGHFRVTPQATNLRSVINHACETIDPLLKKYGQKLEISLPENIPLVMIDGRRIHQVLLNLLSNANKYGPSDNLILLESQILNGFVEVSITDQGEGVSGVYQNTIFAGFVRGTNEMRKFQKGTGLGLSVSKTIIEAHGGTIGVRKHKQGGTEFWFTIPITGEE